MPRAQQADLVRAVTQTYPEFLGFAIWDAAGNQLARGDQMPAATAAGVPVFEQVRRSGAPVTMVERGALSGRAMVVFGAPVLTEGNGLAGVVMGALPTARVGQLLQTYGDVVASDAYLVDPAGRLIAHTEQGLEPLADLSQQPPVQRLASGTAQGSMRQSAERGDLLVGLAKVPGLDWGVVVEQPAPLALASTRAGREQAFIVLLVGIALAAVTGRSVANRLAQPIGALTRAVAAFGTREATPPLPDSAVSEVAGLGTAFSTMRDRLLQRESALQASEARYRGLFNGAADGILVLDAGGRVQEWNPAARRLLGYDDESLARLEICALATDPAWPPAVAAAIRRDGVWQGETELRRQDGQILPIEAWIRVVPLPEGPVQIALLRDISERRTAERLQQEFIALVGHELKNPLTALKGYAQLMQRRGTYSASSVDTIITQTSHLERLLNDLLDISRVRSGRLELRHSQLDLTRELRAAIEMAQATTQDHRLVLQAPNEPVEGRWDRDRLQQVFHNLLSNAIKYSPEGGEIEIRLKTLEDQIKISVVDPGIGIAPEALPHLFDRFYRARTATSQADGLGLGLDVTRALIEAHGGRVAVESELGRGSTFTISLPYWPANRAGADDDRPSVLIVEDDASLRDLVQDLLESEGYAVAVAVDGEAGLAAVRQLRPRLMLLDLQLPRVDGPELVEALEREGLRDSLAIVLMTAQQRGRALAEELELEGFLPKPFELNDVLKTVARVVPRPTGVGSG
jgi:PAS domain S-box-containing protein